MTSVETRHSPSSREVYRDWRRWWRVIATGAVLGLGLGLGLSFVSPNRYAATVTLVVQLPKSSSDNEALVRTVEALTTSTVVMNDLAATPGLGLSAKDVADRIEVQRPVGSAVIEVVVIDSSRAQARTLAQRLLSVLDSRIEDLRETKATAAVPLGLQSFGGPPQIEPIVRPLARNAALGGGTGLALGLVLASALAARKTSHGQEGSADD